MYAGILFLFSALAINSWCLGHDQSIAGRLDELERENLAQALISSAQERKINVLQQQLKYFENKGSNARSSRAYQGGTHVSFTSYLSHDVDNIGLRAPIVFDGVTHNDGDSYDKTTGVFTAPLAGVYYFTFFVGEMDVNQINVQLVVNEHNHVVDAQAEGIATNHNSQGGNAAIVRLNAGDRVQVKHRKVGNHLEGADGLRLSTFSGFLMYPTDDVDSIVG